MRSNRRQAVENNNERENENETEVLDEKGGASESADDGGNTGAETSAELKTENEAQTDALKFKFPEMGRLLIAALLILTCYSVLIRLQLLFSDRSLWLDETFVAERIIDNTFFSLAKDYTNVGDPAPFLFVYTVKIITMIFGGSEPMLRLYSFLTFAAMLGALYLVLKRAYKLETVFACLGVALAATLGIYMRYSVELKPYMGDGFWVLFVLFIYHLYNTEKITLLHLFGAYFVAMFFSNIAVFFLAAVIMLEFFFAVREKKSKNIKTILIYAPALLAVFIVYYLLWYYHAVGGNTWITENAFHILGFSAAEIQRNINLLLGVFRHLGPMMYLTLALAAFGLGISIYKKNKLSFVAALAIVIMLVASNFGVMLFVDRINMFVYAVVMLYAAVALDFVYHFDGKAPPKVLAAIIAALLLYNNADFIGYKDFRIALNEANPLIKYVAENIKGDEYFYTYSYADHIVKYKNGYHSNKIGNVQNDNIMWDSGKGGWNVQPVEGESEMDRIVAAGKVYLFFYQMQNIGVRVVEPGLNALRARGYLDLIMNPMATPLYYFTTDKSAVKFRARLTADNLRVAENAISFNITIANTGQALIPAEGPESLSLIVSEYREGELLRESYAVPIGQSLDPGLELRLPANLPVMGRAPGLPRPQPVSPPQGLMYYPLYRGITNSL
jgi:hypothetical protein